MQANNIAELRCLAADAPSHLLQLGSRFELYEGRRLVARGEILRDGAETSAETIHSHTDIEMVETP
jgi:hypothetical protein